MIRVDAMRAEWMFKEDMGWQKRKAHEAMPTSFLQRGSFAVEAIQRLLQWATRLIRIFGTRFVHIQVKTFVPGGRSCSVGMKAEQDFGENFFWVLGGIPESTIRIVNLPPYKSTTGWDVSE
jgi:hypothetical protein